MGRSLTTTASTSGEYNRLAVQMTSPCRVPCHRFLRCEHRGGGRRSGSATDAELAEVQGLRLEDARPHDGGGLAESRGDPQRVHRWDAAAGPSLDVVAVGCPGEPDAVYAAKGQDRGNAWRGRRSRIVATPMIEFHKIWIEQCEAARDIREAFGLEKALGYLIGEKFLNFLEESDRDPAWAGELPAFVAEIKQMFEPSEIVAYLDGVRRVGPLGHVASDEAYEEMRSAGAIDENRSSGQSRSSSSSERRHYFFPDEVLKRGTRGR